MAAIWNAGVEVGSPTDIGYSRQLVAYPHTGFWQPMDTAREYGLLNDLWASGKAPWKTW
jgi:glucose-1-phosphate cytidylyltransferase